MVHPWDDPASVPDPAQTVLRDPPVQHRTVTPVVMKPYVPPRVRRPRRPRPPLPEPSPAEAALEHPEEFLVDAMTGRVRQAGASADDTAWVGTFKTQCEQSLFLFSKAILNLSFLTPGFHRPLCEFIQKRPPQRKLVLAFVGSGKSTLVSRSVPIHMFIQPASANLYFPGKPGVETRIALCCETVARAGDHLRVVESTLESNELLRALWPHLAWQKPSRDAKKWNDIEFILPRPADREFADPSMRCFGVDTAIMGIHPDAKIGDDLISLKAANSLVLMQEAIAWFAASRTRINEDHCLELTIGTRWGIADLYSQSIIPDPTVETYRRGVEDHGEPTWPEWFPREKIARLRQENGVLFSLLYMNEAHDPSLTDFQPDDLRTFRVDGEWIVYDEDTRDLALRMRDPATAPLPPEPDVRGMPLTGEVYDLMAARGAYLRMRSG